jgi:hypothetical protein
VREEEDDEVVKVNVTSEMIQNTDFTGLAEPRTMLVDLCHRPELFKMVLRQTTIQDLEKSIKSFDVALAKHLGAMIECVEAGYQELLEMAKPGGGLRYILQRAMPLLKDCDKIQQGIDVSRSWSADLSNETMHHQRKLQIIRKRIEIAVEKLDAAIQSESEISFASFMKDLASHAFVCDGKWHEDRPGPFITQK